MRSYCFKRILLFFPTLLGIICINFALIQFLPGGPVEHSLAENFLRHDPEQGEGPQLFRLNRDTHHNADAVAALEKRFGFDKPLWERFLNEVYRLLSFQFGDSYFHHKSVLELIKEKVPVSVSLGLITFFITYLVCIPLGILRAVKNGSKFDNIAGSCVLIAHAIPSFTIGILLIVLFGGGSFGHFFPIRGLVSDHFAELSFWGKAKDYLVHLFLPALCLSSGSLAFMSTLTKNSVLEQMKQEYVRAARLKGLPEYLVITKHILRNTAIPLVTGFGAHFLRLFFTASLLIETLFSLDGLGLLSYESIVHRDYPVVLANFYLMSLLFIVGNLVSDLLYAYFDPRISFENFQ